LAISKHKIYPAKGGTVNLALNLIGSTKLQVCTACGAVGGITPPDAKRVLPPVLPCLT